MRQPAEAYTKQADFAPVIAVSVKKFLEHCKNVGIELGRFTKRLRARVRIEASVTNGERKSARGQASFAQALASLLRKVTEHRCERDRVVRVFSESVIVGNGFWLGIDHEFVGIAAARFAVQRGTPLAEDLVEFFQRLTGELFHGFDAKRAQCALRDFTDAGNFVHGQRREKTGFAS